MSKTPQRARQVSANSGHSKSKAAPIKPKAVPTSQPKPEIRLAEQNEEPQPQKIKLSPERSGEYFPKRDLPQDSKSGSPTPDSEYPHTQLGTKEGRKGEYPKSREWDYDEKGSIEPKRDIDWTDHGRPTNHDNPHQHDWEPNSTGGTKKHGPAKPVEIPKQ